MTHPRLIAARAQNLAIAAAERSIGSRARRCPCCGWCGLRFRSFAVFEYLRTGVICPRCGSFERHRALSSFYPRLFRELNFRPRLLIHCAPEPSLAATLASLSDRYETSSYGDAAAADHRYDLTAIDRADASCDAFVMNHVLECIEADRAAVAEMFRVLRPGGIAVVAATLTRDAETREIPVESNTARRVYGGRDVTARMAPFDVALHDAAEWLTPSDRRTFGIPAAVPVVVLRKPVGGERRS